MITQINNSEKIYMYILYIKILESFVMEEDLKDDSVNCNCNMNYKFCDNILCIVSGSFTTGDALGLSALTRIPVACPASLALLM